MSNAVYWPYCLAFVPVLIVIGALVWQKVKINRDRRLRYELLRQLQEARGGKRP